MSEITAHEDTFARDRLPPRDMWPELRLELPELQYPARLNAARTLLDEAIVEGHAERLALIGDRERWSYHALKTQTDRIAYVLREELGLIPGNRVLLRGFNGPMLAAAWLAVLKAGGIVVTTMPMLRASELTKLTHKAQIDFALCDHRLTEELDHTARATGMLRKRLTFGNGELEAAMERYRQPFVACDTSAEDVALIAFTSGTTGEPKGTVHFHRDVLVMADIVGRHLLRTSAEDRYVGSPPLGFTFGLGALLVFPLRFRGAAILLESPTPEHMLSAVERHRATCLFTAPVAYRTLLTLLSKFDISSLRRCVSAGEMLPRATSDAWHAATGIRIIDGIGATEMIHMFISAEGEHIRPGATGRPLPGYEARLLDESGAVLAPGQTGRLAVRGPTGCRYLDDARQAQYVRDGWNITGDIYYQDADGYFWFQSRADDMIISAGYNIAGPEVEAALLQHPAVQECAVVGAPDAQRGNIVKAFVVLRDGHSAGAALQKALQDFVKQVIAPYKYPRAIEFVASLPKTQTGKVQRFALRERANSKP
ncbi:MAG TPA: AMP-binding protein [Steroidobacteraceae bacterium]|nr:AMP-binding protein [Steroidobacteraceae bacterium]